MLVDLIKSGFGIVEDYNCAEKILYGSNQVYQLGIAKDTLKIGSGFGGGMMTEKTCGAVTASIMVLGMKFTSTVAHESEILKPMVQKFISEYEKAMNSVECMPLKKDFRTDEDGCMAVILKAAYILDQIMMENESVHQ